MRKHYTITTFVAALALSQSAFADDYITFHVCQDQRVIHTSDGADSGHVEYIVVDPSSSRIVSSVVTGGVIGEKYVAVPYESMRFNADNEIYLTEINRERIISAPVIERSLFTASTRVIHQDVFQRTSDHFGVRFDANVNIRDRERREPERREGDLRTGDRREGDRRDMERRDGDRRETPPPGRAGSEVKGEGQHDGDKRPSGAEDKRPGRNTTDPAAPPPGRENDKHNRPGEKRGEPQADKDQPAHERGNTQNRPKGEAENAHKDPGAPPSPRAGAEDKNESGAGGQGPANKRPATQPPHAGGEEPKPKPRPNGDAEKGDAAKGEGQKPHEAPTPGPAPAPRKTPTPDKGTRGTNDEKPTPAHVTEKPQDKAKAPVEKPMPKPRHEPDKSDDEPKKGPRSN